MDKSIQKRFEYLKEESTENLKEELITLKKELEDMKKDIADNKVSGMQASEMENSDIPYNRDKIQFIEEELKNRTM